MQYECLERMPLQVVAKCAQFELRVHAILHSHMLMTCGLLHAIHVCDHA
jgi:hypothetical protein